MKITIEYEGVINEIEADGCVVCAHDNDKIETWLIGGFSYRVLRKMKKLIVRYIKDNMRKVQKVGL